MNKVDIEEAPISAPISFWKKYQTILIIVGVLSSILIITGIVLAVVLTTGGSSTETSSSPSTESSTEQTSEQTTTESTSSNSQSTSRSFIFERLNYRIDCFPWLRNKTTDVNIQTECAKNFACKYDDVDGNIRIPSCFYDTDLLTVDSLEMEETQLGESYSFRIKSGSILDKFINLKIDFEYLEDNVLRFKVCI